MILTPVLAAVLAALPEAAHRTETAPVDSVGSPAPFVLATPQASRPGWEWTLKPYLWFPGLEVSAKVGSLPLADMRSPSLGFAPMIGGEGISSRRTWGVLVDYFYFDISADKGTSEGDFTQSVLEADAFWRLPDLGQTDVFLGLRWWNLQTDVTAAGSSDSERTDWVDPITGARTAISLADDWDLRVRTDVGGFGVGSDLTWQTILGFAWGFDESGQLDLGWRFLDVDYDGSFAFDAQYSGPMLGLIWTF